MEITLISNRDYELLKTIQEKYPKLTFQNNGYEYLDKREFSAEETSAFAEVESILRRSITGFSKFFNFCLSKEGRIRLRFNYRWDEYFTGVGYILLDELKNGFES